MNNERNRERFERLMAGVKRPGIENLMNYIRRSDFFTAPASTQFHLACPGGLLQHSLNVYDVLEAGLTPETAPDGTPVRIYACAGRRVAWFTEESVTIMGLLHDICKTNFYGTELRNRKVDGKWQQVPVYVVDDKVPYGHGEKSVMMIEQFMRLKPEERYAIRWHMGFTDTSDVRTISQAIERYPAVWALHDADIKASKFMEGAEGNLPAFEAAPAQEPEPRQMSMEDLQRQAEAEAAMADADGFMEAESL